MEHLTIGGLAKQAHVNRETARYYERCRLLPRAARSMSGYRVFSDDAVRRLRFIRHAQALGFSLGEIRELLALRVNSMNTCDRVRERTEVKIADIERKIESLAAMRDALSELVTACSGRRRTKVCPILDSLEANGWFERQTGGHNG
jgi:MerR family transcriptional regulator, copper efflux regulator